MGYENDIINEKECGCHTIKTSHDFFNETSYNDILCDEHNEITKVKLTPYQRNKLWRQANPEKYKEQNRRKYQARKERMKALKQL